MNKEVFYNQIRRQSKQWELIDKKLVEEETEVKPYKSKPKKEKGEKVKGRNFI